MKDEERREVREALLEAVEEIRRKLPKLREGASPVSPDNAVGRLSRMDAIREKGVREAALQEATGRLKTLENRLRKVGEKDFNLCRTCRDPIPIGRLLFVPETDLCLSCAISSSGA